MKTAFIPVGFYAPPREFSVLPFWFWNDELSEAKLAEQIDDFVAHGVYGFTIHPRVGLPRDTGFMSERMGHFIRFAVDYAAKKQLQVVLYDEGMYPSGSASGLVVRSNSAFACRCLARVSGDAAPAGANVVARFTSSSGERFTIVDRPVDTCIRGIHYVGEGPDEDEPPATDLLNPDATATFIRIVYDQFFNWVGPHFGKTVLGIFTDEPAILGRCREQNVMPGTTGILEHVERILGYDFTPHLPALWDNCAPDAEARRKDYLRATCLRLEETYYQPISKWCRQHGVALMGHPSKPDDLSCERYFQIPGQDLVWRKVIAATASAIEGEESTQAKCSSSAMIHLKRRRNSNELYGAYGHELTFTEMKGLADWCFVRGVNLLLPHAFYYSIRGPRRDERPPDVGPNSAWWPTYKIFAEYAARLSWLNSDCTHVCSLAILGESDRLPWRAAKKCLQNQRDFNYLDPRHLWEDATVDASGVHLAGMHYRAVIVEAGTHIPARAQRAVDALAGAGRLIEWNEGVDLLAALDRVAPAEFALTVPCADLRVRHVVKESCDFWLFTNEGAAAIEFTPAGAFNAHTLVDPYSMKLSPFTRGQSLRLGVAESCVVIGS